MPQPSDQEWDKLSSQTLDPEELTPLTQLGQLIGY